jgi:hypothetical protein
MQGPRRPASGKSTSKVVDSGLTLPAWGGIPSVPTKKTKAQPWVNPAWANYLVFNAKTGGSYQQASTAKKTTYGSGSYIQQFIDGQIIPTSSKTTDASSPLVYTLPEQVKFNLPPHNNSLPLRPSDVNPDIYARSDIQHNTRRAIMWYYTSSDGLANTGTYTSDGTTGGADTTLNTGTDGKPGDAAQYNYAPDDTYWGFQFLWNPENISTITTRNSNVVPSNFDKFANQSSLFTAMEAVSFTITIDRTNDFAFAKALYAQGATADSFSQYYTTGYPGDQTEKFADKFNYLMKRGTLADIEYIYRTINASGQNGNRWLNGFGQETAELGFLSPTAIAVRFGPNPESMSYVGWVESLQITHNKFTEDMIPLNSTVTLQFNAFSRVSLSSGKA